MIRILHGSDIHFGKPYLPEAGEAFLDAAHALEPDVVVISGDFTQRAKVHEYEQARAFLHRLPDVPLVVTPGNHDVPLYRIFERIFAPFQNYRRYIHNELDVVTRVPGATFVSLSTAAPHRAITNGRIGDDQLAFADRAFEDDEDARIVVLHHHLAPAPDYEGDRALPRGRRILERLEAMGVDMVLGGHLHRAYIGNSLDVYPREDRQRGVIIVQSGTTTSRRGRARERDRQSFNVIHVSASAIEVQHLMYFPAEGRFVPISMHAFPRGRKRFFDPQDVTRTSRLLSGEGS